VHTLVAAILLPLKRLDPDTARHGLASVAVLVTASSIVQVFQRFEDVRSSLATLAVIPRASREKPSMRRHSLAALGTA